MVNGKEMFYFTWSVLEIYITECTFFGGKYLVYMKDLQ